MRVLLVSMVIGVVAGMVDILPMVAQRLSKKAIVSAFLQYFFVAIVVLHVELPGVPWFIKGGLVSLALALPIAVLVSETDKKAAPIILGTSVVLGTLIGVAGYFWLG